MKEIRYIDIDRVRNFCILYNFYTRGSNSDYSNMLEMCKKLNRKWDLRTLKRIAKDIIEHTDAIAFRCSTGYEEPPTAMIAKMLINTCCTSIIEDEEN